MSNATPLPARSAPLLAVGWAVFLACSWTWCIGMFLPVLLVRDYGPLGWLAFAVPNVIGAGAMGWVLARPGSSEALVTAHRPACAAFSVVTLAFHVHFAFLVAYLSSLVTITIVAGAFLVMLLLGEWRRRADLWSAVVVWLGSVVLLAGILPYPMRAPPVDMGRANAALAYLVPVMVFGFVLCPYLDLTFHRARQALPATGSRVAFTLGFGFFFLAMIAGTLFYAPRLATVTTYGSTRAYLGVYFATGLALHLGLQAAYTTAVHVRELRRLWQWALAPLVVAAVVIGACYPFFNRRDDMNWFEGAYRVFMGFYGLAFPAYVWICMIPTWRSPARPSRRSLAVCTAAILVAAPMYWLGFVEKRTTWLLPGLGVVLLARLAARKTNDEWPMTKPE